MNYIKFLDQRTFQFVFSSQSPPVLSRGFDQAAFLNCERVGQVLILVPDDSSSDQGYSGGN